MKTLQEHGRFYSVAGVFILCLTALGCPRTHGTSSQEDCPTGEWRPSLSESCQACPEGTSLHDEWVHEQLEQAYAGQTSGAGGDAGLTDTGTTQGSLSAASLAPKADHFGKFVNPWPLGPLDCPSACEDDHQCVCIDNAPVCVPKACNDPNGEYETADKTSCESAAAAEPEAAEPEAAEPEAASDDEADVATGQGDN